MKSEEKTNYVTPELKTYELQIRNVICGSIESYEDGGDLSDSFGNE